MITPVVEQKSFRGRNDDVTLNSSTFNGGGGLNTNWNQAPDTNFRIRFTIQETAGATITQAYELRYSYDGGAYTTVNSSATHVRPSLSSQFADHDNTTQVLGTGTGTFVAGDGLEAAEDTDSIILPISGNTELEFCLTILKSATAGGKTIAFRVYTSASVAINTYTVTPTVTISGSAKTSSLTDSVTISDSPSKGVTKPLTDSFAIADSMSYVKAKPALRFNNYHFIEVGDGMSASERIK